MMNHYKFLLLFLLLAGLNQPTLAQAFNDNVYRNSSNAMYWQNRKPHAAYWQQDVQYKIKADIDEKTNIISGSEELTYWNNSPDTLNVVFFHLYQNAFVQGSYLQNLHELNEAPVTNLGPYASNGLGTTVENVKVNDRSADMELDNTVLKVKLPNALLPGGKAVISMQFKTYFEQNGFRRRMAMYNSWGAKHYNGVHWYPRISVYDSKKGWDTDQHLNKELYGDFGLFDVELRFASNYVVEATGELQNPQEVYPGNLREQLDIKHFANKPWNEAPSVITPYDPSKRKTWHFIARNVHDFAFTADPHYRLGETTWNGIKCVALVVEPHAGKWQSAPAYISRIIQTFSTDFGMYEYPKMVVADANDGMEYPMLTLCGGAEPDFHGLFAHEIGHNWFYGMIGNNETYRAALDEGFTQFITAWALEKLDGPVLIGTKDKNKYRAAHQTPALARDARVFNTYITETAKGLDKQLNTHSDDFQSALGHEGGYRLVYYKTATMLFNLQYVLGDELFLNAMKHYVSKWKIAHPYFEDFRTSIIEYTHQDLNWFFDQWMETTKTLDYGITCIRKGKHDTYRIRLRRHGEMQMPVDFRVIAKDKQEYNYTIPNTWFVKNISNTVLPKWYGWGRLNRDYVATVTIPSGIRQVQLDPSNRLADIDMMDNYAIPHRMLSRRSLSLKPEWFVNNTSSWKTYNAFWRPDIWWNAVDGIKAGLHIEGSYLNLMRKLSCTVWFNTRLLSEFDYRAYAGESWWSNASPVDYTVRYENQLKAINRHINWGIASRFMDGMAKHSVHAGWQLRTNDLLRIEAVSLYRNVYASREYLFYPKEWSSYMGANTGNFNPARLNTQMNAYLQLGFSHTYNYHGGNGVVHLTLRTPITYQYSYLQGEAIHRKSWHKLDISARAFARFGTGTQIPNESALFMQGGSPEEMMENKFTRSQGIIPRDISGMSTTDFSHLHAGGGLNLRGYTGYYAIDESNGSKYINYKGRSGAAVNLEVDFDRLLRLRPKVVRDYLHLDTYVFADAGAMSRGVLDPANLQQLVPVNQWSKIRMDAGLGAALTIKKFGPLNKINPFTIRADFPFFLSAPPNAQPEEWAFRWLIGVSRAF